MSVSSDFPVNYSGIPEEAFYQAMMQRPPYVDADDMHADKLHKEIKHINEELEFIATHINKIMRSVDPRVDVLRRANERITFNLRRLHYEFMHYIAYHRELKEDIKIRNAMAAGVARANANGGTATSTDSSSSGGDNDTETSRAEVESEATSFM